MTVSDTSFHYRVTAAHRSEFPAPIALAAGETVAVGERYAGPEGWDEWYCCTNGTGVSGWVPGQILARNDEDVAQVLEDYTARELDVDPGQMLCGRRHLNGWCWCEREADGASGWVPLSHLQPADAEHTA
ncbi:hypothetical protein IMZ29_08410 [Achromobacter sp. GG226]|uniref:SH3 domain-containing protein n=1 Tax=Verticiella alkaliphila TaxID=2779529 RepID=UPI001C0C44E0|nr:SH3 domain-containing protein [Verticiella sp. GG226]MBU4610560.1 hypothetical protein [Verticiella sp. GG226]